MQPTYHLNAQATLSRQDLIHSIWLTDKRNQIQYREPSLIHRKFQIINGIGLFDRKTLSLIRIDQRRSCIQCRLIRRP